MGLNYDLRETSVAGREMSERTQQLIFVTMLLGVSGITDKNWKEVYVRLNMWESAFGPFFISAPYTPAMIHAHIGLKVNVSPESKAKFKNRLAKSLRVDSEERVEKWERTTVTEMEESIGSSSDS